MFIGSKEGVWVNKYVQNFEGEITVMVDITNIQDTPYGVYSFVGNVLVGAFYFEDEKEANEKYQKIVNGLKEELSWLLKVA